MSNLEQSPQVALCAGHASPPVHHLMPGREVTLGGTAKVRRLLPNLDRRLVGAWCFIDHYGPDDIAADAGMRVGPHPHLGLQTVSWLLDGEILHRDSLGSEQLLRPGQLGLMTAGAAISHAEQSPDAHTPLLHGVQLWVALPDAHRQVAPHWEHHASLPVLAGKGLTATVFMGELAGEVSPGTTYSPLVGAELLLDPGADVELPLRPDFEYAVLTLAGAPEVDGVAVPSGSLLYLGCGRSGLRLRAERPSRAMLLGGVPFDEEIVMWWNFVARSGEEIAAARAGWMESDRFGTVSGYRGDRIAAPVLPAVRLKPGGAVRRAGGHSGGPGAA